MGWRNGLACTKVGGGTEPRLGHLQRPQKESASAGGGRGNPGPAPMSSWERAAAAAFRGLLSMGAGEGVGTQTSHSQLLQMSEVHLVLQLACSLLRLLWALANGQGV